MLKNVFLHLTIWLFFCQGYSSTPTEKFSRVGLRQSPGIEIDEEGGSIEDIQPPSSSTQSRELSRWTNSRKSSSRGTRFIVDASGLYWRAHENGLAYAVRSSSTHKLAPKSEIENPDFDWDFGFRVGLGYHFSNDYDLLLQFTSLQTHASSDTFAHHGEVLFPSWQKPTDDGPHFAKQVHTHWRLHLGLVDLMLAKRCEFSDYFALTPQAGVRAGSIRQKYYLDYFGGSFTDGEEIVHMKNKFFGVGPNAGLAAEWALGKGFSLFGKSLFSILFGHFFLHQNDYSRGGKERPLGVRDFFAANAPVMDFTAGISWRRNRIWLCVAWDELLCFSQNQLLRFTSAEAGGIFFSNQGDLFVSGLELAMRFDF